MSELLGSSFVVFFSRIAKKTHHTWVRGAFENGNIPNAVALLRLPWSTAKDEAGYAMVDAEMRASLEALTTLDTRTFGGNAHFSPGVGAVRRTRNLVGVVSPVHSLQDRV